MNCAHVPTALATGGILSRWRARRHAARCPRCASAAADLVRIADALAAVEPLTPVQRALWTSAAVEDVHDAAPIVSRWLRPALAGGLLAGLLAVVVVIMRPGFRGHPEAQPRPPVPAPGAAEFTRLDPAPALERLDTMRGSLDALAGELADLRRRADLLDARRDADALWTRLGRPAA
jgi:hypothetical protein